MREIKFRGKTLDKEFGTLDQWIFGDLLHVDKDTYIITSEYHEGMEGTYSGITTTYIKVDPFTVGQYTGLKDKHGKEIYEGDVIKHAGGESSIRFADSEWQVDFGDEYDLLKIYESFEIEIIGTIHDEKKVEIPSKYAHVFTSEYNEEIEAVTSDVTANDFKPEGI